MNAPNAVARDMARLPGGAFRMGGDRHCPETAPAHKVRVGAFWIDRHCVTNAEFAGFVAATGYVTLDERPAQASDYPGADPTLLVPSSLVFRKPPGPVDLANHYNWWTYVAGADWRHSRGRESSIRDLAQHPAVHVASDDAQAYAASAGKPLPIDAESEFAARGGLDGAEFVRGDEFEPEGRMLANTWQGRFPWENTCADGHEWTAPAGSYPPNGYGLYDMAGNV